MTNNNDTYCLFDEETMTACTVEELIEEDFDETESTENDLNNSNIIRNISHSQKKILYNIMQLHNDGKPFDCDITASSLKFYEKKKTDEYVIPEPKYLFDVYPQNEKIKKITPFQRIPLDDNSIESVVVNLPFVISPHTAPSTKVDKEKSNIIQKRFASWYPAMEGYENMYWWISECFRVVKEGGTVVWKMQSTVSGGLNHWYTPFCFMVAQKLGFYVIDEFILEAKARLISSSKIKKQQHARKYTSTFLVFKKDSKRANKTNLFNILDQCSRETLEGKVWEVK